MSWTDVVAARARGLFDRRRSERELDDEVRFHLEMRMDDNVKAGMDPAEARYAALRDFGAIEPMKENYRDRRGVAILENAARDVRYALRTLWRNRGYTVTSVTVLALAIGANTAMFSVLDAVLLRPLPFPAPEQLAMLWSEIPGQGVREARTAYMDIEQWRQESKSFADMAFFDGFSATLTGGGQTEQISGVRASPNLFSLLGVQPLHGRGFTAEETERRERVAVIGYRFWQTRFGGSFAAIGSSIELDGRSSRIIGVLPPDVRFAGLGGAVLEPHTTHPDWEALRRARGTGFWSVIGRLRPGATIEAAQAEMSTIARRMEGNQYRGISVVPLDYQITGAQPRLALAMLSGAVFLVLLIAAANVAGLTLARSASREKEMSIRTAIGASRGRIAAQLLTESLTLALASGAAGVAVAWAGIRGILALRPDGLARIDEVSLDPRVLAAAVGICLLTGVLVGMAPAVVTARRAVAGRGRMRRVLVGTEFALAIVLLVGAGLLMRSLWSVEGMDPGFRVDRVLAVSLASPPLLPVEQRAGFYTRVLERIRALPGVEVAGVTSELLIGGTPERPVTVEGEAQPVAEPLRFRSDELSDGVFAALGTPLLQGRMPTAGDGVGTARVAVVNETMARRLWPGRDPVGRRFKPGGDGAAWFTVIGVVGDMRRQGLELAPVAQMFEPLAQNPPRRVILVVRASMSDALRLAGPIRAAVADLEKQSTVYGISSLEDQLGARLAQRRFQTTLLLGFAAVAMLMAAIGIYGLIQYSITARIRELGIRMAIGAQRGQIFRMILGEGLRLSLTGLAAGLVGAFWMGQAVSSLLFGITATDPVTFGAVSLLLTGAALAACYFPARRAMKVEPMVALRYE